MGSRGRKSVAELSVVTPIKPRRNIDPPPELTDAQAAVWRDCAASMRPDQLTRASRPILVAYCRHVCRARTLENLICTMNIEAIKKNPDLLSTLDKLLAMAERETRAATACARALRLTPQSQMHPRTAARRAHDFPGGYVGENRKPWE